MKRIVSIVIIFIILIAIPLTVFLGLRSQELRKKAAPATNLTLVPASVTKNINDEFTVEARIDTADNQVIATQINLVYDPAKLEATSITNGTLFPNILSSGIVGNGTASIAVGAANTTTPVHGTGTAAVIKFKALAATMSPITIRFAPDTYVGALGEGSTNVLIGTSPATITIKSTLSTTPTIPSSSILPTPTPSSTEATPSAVKILSPLPDEALISELTTFQGSAPAGSTVTIVIHSSDEITTSVTADENGNWTYTLVQPLSAGPHTLVVAATDPQTSKSYTATVAFVVSSGNENGASDSAMPVSGTYETTVLLLVIGVLFIITGSILPMAAGKSL